MMSFKDFLIFYLACGASFGASYFFQNRKKYDDARLWLKTFLTVVVWIPYALEFLHEFVTKKFPNAFSSVDVPSAAARHAELGRIERDLTKLIAERFPNSVFELREVLARYSGLSAACLSISENESPSKAAQEIFRLTGHKNPALGARCRFRQNAVKLRRHRKIAALDLLVFFENAAAQNEHAAAFRHLISEVFELFDDREALNSLDEFLPAARQNARDSFVPVKEKDLWKTINTQQLHSRATPAKTRSTAIARLNRD